MAHVTQQQVVQHSLNQLPSELLEQLLEYLDRVPPSETILDNPPSSDYIHQKDQRLKNLSLCSKRLRGLCFDKLFKHVRLEVSDSAEFLLFILRNKAIATIDTVTAYSLLGAEQGGAGMNTWWQNVCSTIPIKRLNIICTPRRLATLLDAPINEVDHWIFTMPYHIIRFEQDHPSLEARQMAFTLASHVDDSELCKIGFPSNSSILTIQPWNSFTIHEGSSLKAYSQYEYFLRCPPSLLPPFNRPGAHRITIRNAPYTTYVSGTRTYPVSRMNLDESPATPLKHSSFLLHLRSFTYCAIFPFYNHIDEILKTIDLMISLETLTVQLAPHPSSPVIDDEIAATRNHIDINDAWMEFDTSYTLIAHYVKRMGSMANHSNQERLGHSLTRFVSRDVQVEGIRDALEKTVNKILGGGIKGEGWLYLGNGIWEKEVMQSKTASSDSTRD